MTDFYGGDILRKIAKKEEETAVRVRIVDEEIERQKEKLLQKKNSIRAELSDEKESIVRAMAFDFVKSVCHEDFGKWNRRSYVNGTAGHSHPFTKYVSRLGFDTALSDAHRAAQQEYKAALRNLKQVFMDEIVKDPEGALEKFVRIGYLRISKMKQKEAMKEYREREWKERVEAMQKARKDLPAA